MLMYGRVDDNKRDGIVRRMVKKLRYYTVLLPLFSSCGSAAPQISSPNTMERPAVQESVGSVDCRISGRTLEYRKSDGTQVSRQGLFQIGENPIDAPACLADEVFILTNKSLIIVYTNREAEVEGPVSINLDSSRTDMRRILQNGFVDWTQSEDIVYVLTLDSKLRALPVHQNSDTINTYTMPFDVLGSRMAYSDGFVLIANAAGQLVVFSFTADGADWRALELPQGVRSADADFFVLGERLFFGNSDGEKIEIVTGRALDDVRLAR